MPELKVKSYALIDPLGKEIFRISGVEVKSVGKDPGAYFLRNHLGTVIGTLVCAKSKLAELPPEKEKK